jgi:hypothetical protein
METIQIYLDSVFAGAPDTAEVAQLKAEMLANMEEKYLELKADGKGENEAIGTVIAEFGNVEELFAELGIVRPGAPAAATPAPDPRPLLGLSQARDYLETTTKSARGISAGVALILAGVAVCIFIAAFTHSFYPGNLISVTDATKIIPVLALFIFLAPPVGLIVYFGTKLTPYKYIEDGQFRLEAAARSIVEVEQAQGRNRNNLRIVAAVVLVFVSIIFLFMAVAFFPLSTLGGAFGISLMLAGIGIAVYLFITAGMWAESYDRLLKQGDYAPEMQTVKKVAGVYWSIVTAAYLIAGFGFGAWGSAWIIYPIAGVLFGAYSAAAKALHPKAN